MRWGWKTMVQVGGRSPQAETAQNNNVEGGDVPGGGDAQVHAFGDGGLHEMEALVGAGTACVPLGVGGVVHDAQNTAEAVDVHDATEVVGYKNAAQVADAHIADRK
jgi:hypothetical protein